MADVVEGKLVEPEKPADTADAVVKAKYESDLKMFNESCTSVHSILALNRAYARWMRTGPITILLREGRFSENKRGMPTCTVKKFSGYRSGTLYKKQVPYTMASSQKKSRDQAQPTRTCGVDATVNSLDDGMETKQQKYVLMDSRQGLVYSPGIWKNLIVDFTLSFLIANPKDLVSFGLEYFNNLRTKKYMMTEEQEEQDHIEEQSNLNPVLEPSSYPETKRDTKTGRRVSLEPPPRIRRKSVFAEFDDGELEDDDEWRPAIYPKTDEQRRNCRERMKEVMLFKEISPDDLNILVDAMEFREIYPGEKVIVQGAPGDYFYVIDSGLYEAFFATNDGIRGIAKYNNHGTFGELALMYNVPRTCSIKALTRGGLWALDRTTFRRVVVRGAKKKRNQYMAFLQKVPLLKHLTEYEMLNLADSFVRKSFSAGEIVIHQGDEADGMYFIEEGTVGLSMIDGTGKEIGLQELGVGDYFGELALIEKQPRAATAHAITEVKLAFLSADAFERLLGSCRSLMESRATQYKRELNRARNITLSLSGDTQQIRAQPHASILSKKEQRDSNPTANLKTHTDAPHSPPAVRLKSPNDDSVDIAAGESSRSIAGDPSKRRSTMKSRQSTVSKRMSKFYDRKPSLFQMLPEMMAKNKDAALLGEPEHRLVSMSDHSQRGPSPSTSPQGGNKVQGSSHEDDQ